MNKRSIILPLLAFLLIGCQNNNGVSLTSENGQESKGIIKEDVTIEFLCLTDNHYQKELTRMIEEFKSVEEKVTVNLINPPAAGNYNVLEKIVISGFFKEDYPDIVQCYPDNVVKYIDRGYAINLNDYLNNSVYGLNEEREDYINTFLEEGSHYSKNGVYSLPFCKSTELLYYNADVLLNLDLSSIDGSINGGQKLTEDYFNNLTWEELFGKLCPAIKAYNAVNNIYDDSNDSGIFTYDSDENFFITLANQYGYGYTSVNEQGHGSVDFNNDEMKELVKTLKTAKDNGYLQTRGSYGDYVSDLFQKRKSLLTVSSTASLSYNYNESSPFKIGVAKLPKASGKSYSSINQGPSVCLLDHKDNNRALASYLLWKHLTNQSNSSSWAVKTGYMGIRNSSYLSEEYQEAINPDLSKEEKPLYAEAVADNLKLIKEVRDTTFNTPVFRGSSNARTNVGLLLTECLNSDDLDNNIDTLFSAYEDDASSYVINNA